MAAAYLATPLRRITAAAIDLAVILLLFIFAAAIVAEFQLGVLNMGIAAVLAFVLYHACFQYYWSGETPGRRILSIRVVRSRPGLDLTLTQCVARPLLRFIWLVSFIVVAGVYGIPWFTLIPLFADLVLMTYLPSRQTVADLLCRTVVVNTPPPQPHWAPAGPMYSATDAEFGVRPRPAR